MRHGKRNLLDKNRLKILGLYIEYQNDRIWKILITGLRFEIYKSAPPAEDSVGVCKAEYPSMLKSNIGGEFFKNLVSEIQIAPKVVIKKT